MSDPSNDELLDRLLVPLINGANAKQSGMLAARAAVLARMSSPSHDRAMAEGGWQPMSSARKDGTPVLLKLKDGISKDRRDLRYWDGVTFVGRHPGVESDGFDLGWQFAAPVGQGGFPDDWFDGWHPMPAPPPPTTKEETDK